MDATVHAITNYDGNMSVNTVPSDESGDGVEFDRVWGVPNPGVDDLPSLLGCFEVSRV